MSSSNPIEAGLIERLSSAIDALGERIFALPKPMEERPGSDRSMRPCAKGQAERDALIGAFQLVDCLSGSLHEEASHLSQTVNELREALKPFAAFADKQDEFKRADTEDFCATIISGETGERWRLTVGDLRRARTALNNSSSSRGVSER